MFKNLFISDMHHFKTCVYINLQQNRVSRAVKKSCTQICLQKITSCINLQTLIESLKKSFISDMHHRITYMYINFQQNRVSRLVKTSTQIYSQKQTDRRRDKQKDEQMSHTTTRVSLKKKYMKKY